MSDSIQKINLIDIDLSRGNIHRSWCGYAIGMKDNNGDAFGIRVFRNRGPVDLTGISVQGFFRNSVGTNIAITSGNTVSGNTAYVVLPQACYDYDGPFTLAIKLIGGGVTGTMRIIDGMVDNTNTSGAVAPTGAVPTYQEVLSVFEQMQDALEDYDDVVATQNAQISDLKSALKNSVENGLEQITGNRGLVFERGYYRVYGDNTVVDISAPETNNTTSKTMVTALCTCQPGDSFFIRAYGGANTAAAYGFLDADKKGIYRYTTNNALVETRIIAPDNAAYFIVNNNTTNNPSNYYAYKGIPLATKTNNARDEINSLLDGIAERVNWLSTASDSYPIGGWIVGSWNETTGAWESGSRAIALQASMQPPTPDCDYLIAQSFSDEWGISVIESDKDNTYLRTYGTISGSGRTSVIYCPVDPKHRYRFNVGTFAVGKGSSFLTWTNVNNIKVWFGKTATKAKQIDIARDIVKETVKANSIGNMQTFYLDDVAMETYKLSNGNIVRGGDIRGTDFIKCNSTFFYGLQVEPYYDNTDYYVYIYDDQKQIVWDVLDYTAENGEKNKFTPDELKEINGFVFSELPDGYYIRVGMYRTNTQGNTPRLYVWNGIPFGVKLTGINGAFSGNSFIDLPDDGGGVISVTQDIDAIMAKPGYTFVGARIRGSNGTYTDVPNASLAFPCQFLSLNGYPGWQKNKSVMIVKNYDYETGEYDPVAVDGDLSEYVCAIVYSSKRQGLSIHSNEMGKSWLINRLIKRIMAIEWECKKDIQKSATDTYKAGVTYHGVPYRSDWQHASNFGWHVTAHTFVNAANDPDSIFYNGAPYGGSELKPGPYYSLVCSSFATFVCYFDYPEANYGLAHDPNMTIEVDNDPGAGSLIMNGVGHCMVPMLKTVGDNLYGYAQIGEASGLFTRLVNFFSEYTSTEVGAGAFGNNDLRNYIYKVNLKDDLNVLECLNTTDQEIVNGSARPYKGDGSVYTTKEDVVINIKDPDATRLYYQKVTGSFSRGRPTGTLTASGTAEYVNITAGTTQVTLRTKTTEGSYTGVELEHNAVYAVWASVGSSQTTRPANAEYFEWHDLSLEQITYSYENGVLVTDDEFWYARGYGKNYRYPLRTSNGGLVSIPYEKPRKSMDGTTTDEHSDYSRYADGYILDSTHQMFFFRKGKLGNYLASGTFEAPGPEPD